MYAGARARLCAYSLSYKQKMQIQIENFCICPSQNMSLLKLHKKVWSMPLFMYYVYFGETQKGIARRHAVMLYDEVNAINVPLCTGQIDASAPRAHGQTAVTAKIMKKVLRKHKVR